MSEDVDIHRRGYEIIRDKWIGFLRAIHSGNYVQELCYFSHTSGGSYLFQQGHNYHADEIDFASIAADKGHHIEMQPEDNVKWASKWKNGRPKYCEGTFDNALYEQSTTTNVRKCLNHAVDKNAKVACLYDKFGLLSETDIKDGIKTFLSYPHNVGRVKDLYVGNGAKRNMSHYKMKRD